MNVLNEIESTIPVENNHLTEQEKTLIDYLKKEKVNEFTRQNVEKILSVQKSRASAIIKSLINKHYIENFEYSKYRLVSK